MMFNFDVGKEVKDMLKRELELIENYDGHYMNLFDAERLTERIFIDNDLCMDCDDYIEHEGLSKGLNVSMLCHSLTKLSSFVMAFSNSFIRLIG